MTRERRLSWINGFLLPFLNVLTAFIATAIVFVLIGVDPIKATKILIYGALGYDEGLGYTLYYATNFVFTGLAVAVAFHAGLFNIGGEGQAYVGGLGTALVALYLNPALSAWIVIPLCYLRRTSLWSTMGYYSCLLASLQRKSYCYYNNYVQLSSIGLDGLCFG